MLYNEERPTRFSQMKGQESNRLIFRNMVKTNNFAHAYLFAGKHGSGKTTSARILAKAAVCEHPTDDGPCMECESCKSFAQSIDVIEIDAASNTGVDAVRDKVVEAVRYAPVNMKKKIIIIDEVHMLSNSAFNALLKTIEEPPEYVILFLCTTDLHKVPKTIVSRCVKFIFNDIPFSEICEALKEVSIKHSIQIEDDAVRIIAKGANGSMRDALSLLETAASDNVVTKERAIEVVGYGDEELIDNILDSILRKDYKSCFDSIDSFLGYSNTNVLVDSILERIISRALQGEDKFINLVREIGRIRGRENTVLLKSVLYTFSQDNEFLMRIEKLEEDVERLKALGISEVNNMTIETPEQKVEPIKPNFDKPKEVEETDGFVDSNEGNPFEVEELNGFFNDENVEIKENAAEVSSKPIDEDFRSPFDW